MPRGRVARKLDLEYVEDLAAQGLGVEQIGLQLGFKIGGWKYRRDHDAAVRAALERGYAAYVPEPKRYKTCSSCGRTLSRSEFHKGSSDLRSHCKHCRSRDESKYKSRVDRFWKTLEQKTILVDDCRIWQGHCGAHDLPMCVYQGRNRSVRRLVYILSVGDVGDNEYVFTTCKNKKCVSRYHLEKGTKEDRERMRANSMPTGEKHPSRTHPESLERGQQRYNAKLTDELVREIRERAKTTPVSRLAKEMGIPRSRVRSALYRWKHIHGP